MEYLTNLLNEYGLIAMFLIIMLEYACFPVSSEIVLPFSGAIACSQNIHYFVILTTSVIAGLLGTTICYCIGYFGGSKLLDTLMHRFPKSEKGIKSSYKTFEKYGSFAVCITRVIPLCRTYIGFISGTVKQSYSSFLLSSFIGIFVWNAILIGGGYFLKDNWSYVNTYYHEYKHFLIPILLGILAFLIIQKKLKNKESQI